MLSISLSSSINPFPSGTDSLHYMTLGAFHRSGAVFTMAADALLVEGIRTFEDIFVAFIHRVALRAGTGLGILLGRQGVMTLPA
jgi:uncharacterized protein YunC (DUF1805 family)